MKIKSSIVMAAAAGSAFAPNAQAADMPVKGPRVSPAPAWSWTGFYVGAHLGYAWQKNATSGTYEDGGDLFPFNHSSNPKGFLGGAQIGYNWQSGKFVFGVETDITGIGGNKAAVSSLNTPDEVVVTSNNRIKWVGTARGRLGVTVGPRTMVYGTGGLAYGRVKQDHSEFSADGPDLATWNSGKTKTGYAAGGGIEHAVRDNVTLRLEGLHVDLGDTTLATNNTGTCDTFCHPVTFKNKATMVRAGVNVRF